MNDLPETVAPAAYHHYQEPAPQPLFHHSRDATASRREQRDPKRTFAFGNDQLMAVEIGTTASNAALVLARRKGSADTA
jgi:hypothetical protein